MKRPATQQEQFLTVVSAEEAERILWDALKPAPVGVERVPLEQALGRVLAEDVVSRIDVPAFDRSNVDGYAVRAQDTFGAEETAPVPLQLNGEVIHTAVVPKLQVTPGTATPIATGGVMPRGADAVVMVEYTLPREGAIQVQRASVPGGAVTFAGTDIGAGETVLHRHTRLSSRETGVLAAVGHAQVPVFRKPRVGILSTGDEIIPPGAPMGVGKIYDSNATIVADAVRELGAEPTRYGIVPDDAARLREVLERAMAECDFVLLSGGTSKGAGDLNYEVVATLGKPGILAHGVALKPGKPLCLALVDGTPIAILPGFPTSAVFTFHKFIAPVLRVMSGVRQEDPEQIDATLPMRVNSDKGRTEFLLVSLVRGREGLSAYPMGKGSGSVTTFSKADGFIEIARNAEYLEAGEPVRVTLIGSALGPADLIFVGSQCVGADYLLSQMSARGWRVKLIAVGSQGGLAAAKRGECDLAGMHLLDEASEVYNQPFLDASLTLQKGYGRRQGICFRSNDTRFSGKSLEAVTALVGGQAAKGTEPLLMINRNRGSGTRVLVDKLLAGARPEGYHVEAKSHNAVAAAVHQGRVDWGVAIINVTEPLGLGFLPLVDEEYDFAMPTERLERPAVQAFRALLAEPATLAALRKLGMTLPEPA